MGIEGLFYKSSEMDVYAGRLVEKSEEGRGKKIEEKFFWEAFLMMSPLRGMFMLGRPSYGPWHTVVDVPRDPLSPH